MTAKPPTGQEKGGNAWEAEEPNGGIKTAATIFGRGSVEHLAAMNNYRGKAIV